jgi:glycosyltransferase involved in cell wall biosynthesis
LEKAQKSLLVISDTPMYLEGGRYTVLESTLREIEFLADHFSSITWIGYPYIGNNGLGRLPKKSNITLRQFPRATGGKSAWAKLKIIPYIPLIWLQIIRELRKHDVIHTRGPSVPALLTLLTARIYKMKYWHKYAGNWRQAVLPKAYALQRYLLRTCDDFVAVNGRLPGDPENIHTIENPCSSTYELKQSALLVQRKDFTGKLIMLFVGRVESKKGIFELLEAFRFVKDKMSLHVVGPGDSMEQAIAYTTENLLPVHFYGALQREKLNELYQHAHILILPSKAEGFPKVIAEGAAFGCIPVCSDISSIGEYIQHGTNGFLIKNVSASSIAELLEALPGAPALKEIAQRASELAELFTYERYVDRIKQKLAID